MRRVRHHSAPPPGDAPEPSICVRRSVHEGALWGASRRLLADDDRALVRARSEPATGDRAQAKTNLIRAARPRPRLDYALPWSAAAFHSAASNPRMTSSANPPLAHADRRRTPSWVKPTRVAAWIIAVLSAR